MGVAESKKDSKSIPIKPAELQTFVMIIQAKLTQGRNKKVQEIKKKREEVLGQLRDSNIEMAKLKVESILRYEDFITACDLLSNLCELLKEKITYLLSFPACPDELRAVVETLIFASSRIEIDEFQKFRELMKGKYGEKFVTEANANTSGLVNKNIVKQLSVYPFDSITLMVRLKFMAKEENIEVEFPEEILAPITDFSNPFVNSQDQISRNSNMGDNNITNNGNNFNNNMDMGSKMCNYVGESQQKYQQQNYQPNYQQQNYQPNYQQNYQQNYQPNYQQNYQPDYQQNYQPNYQQNYPTYQQNYQQPPDIYVIKEKDGTTKIGYALPEQGGNPNMMGNNNSNYQVNSNTNVSMNPNMNMNSNFNNMGSSNNSKK